MYIKKVMPLGLMAILGCCIAQAGVFEYHTVTMLNQHVTCPDTLVVFDIDNTVADTWPTLVDNHQSSWNRLSSLKAFEGVVNLIRDFSISGEKVIFISARDNRFHFLTRKWLVKNVVKDFDLLNYLSTFQPALVELDGHKNYA